MTSEAEMDTILSFLCSIFKPMTINIIHTLRVNFVIATLKEILQASIYTELL